MTRRRSDRIHLQIPIRVTGRDALGAMFEEETVTVNINHHGACIILTRSLEPGQTTQIRNLGSGQEQEFRVVGMVRQIFGDRGEWGVELCDPTADFWGVEFTPPPDSAQPKVLIQCQACSKVTLAPLSRLEYDLLLHTGLVSRHCDQCDQTTRWQPGEEPPAFGAATGAPKPLAHDERRKARRMRLVMRLQLRTAKGQSEIVQTTDVSKHGLSFLSKQAYAVGEQVFLDLPHRQEKKPTESKARIVWSREVSAGLLYGVTFLLPDSAPALVREHAAQIA